MKDIPDIAFEHYLKVPVVRRKDYEILLEEHLEGTFIHCDVRNWTLSSAKAMGTDFELLCELHGGPIHALHDSRDRKHEKFLKFYGFEVLRPHEDHLEVWIWRNNG
jgi:hypothetical protein